MKHGTNDLASRHPLRKPETCIAAGLLQQARGPTWLRYWQHGAFIPEFPLEDFPTVAALEASWSELEQAQRAFVAGLTDEALLGQRAFDEHSYTLGELIHQTLNHSTYHRGQVAVLLRQLGHPPPATDFRIFLTEARYGAA